MSKVVTKNSVMSQLVALEQFLNQLKEDVEHAKYRRNQLLSLMSLGVPQASAIDAMRMFKGDVVKAEQHLLATPVVAENVRRLVESVGCSAEQCVGTLKQHNGDAERALAGRKPP